MPENNLITHKLKSKLQTTKNIKKNGSRYQLNFFILKFTFKEGQWSRGMVMHTCNPSTLETDKIFVNSLDRITVSARTVRDCETLSQNTNKMASETVQRGGRVLATEAWCHEFNPWDQHKTEQHQLQSYPDFHIHAVACNLTKKDSSPQSSNSSTCWQVQPPEGNWNTWCFFNP